MKKRSSVPVAVILAVFLFISWAAAGRIFAESAAGAKVNHPLTYNYNPRGKSDPFQSFVEKELLLMKKKQEEAKVTSIYPLQKAGVDQFNLVGIAGDAKRKMAIVEAKDGTGRFYPVFLGTIIGLNGGKVVEIKGDHVVIEEAHQGRDGQKINRIMKKLHKDEEEGTTP